MANWARWVEEAYGSGRVHRYRGGIGFQIDRDTIRGYFSGNPVHHRDEKGIWHPIDTKLVEVEPGVFGALGLNTRILPDGTIRHLDHIQRTSRIGMWNPAKQAFSTLCDLRDGSYQDDMLIREAGGFRHAIRLTERGARETLTLESMPNGDSNDWIAIETRVPALAGVRVGETVDFKLAALRFSDPYPAKRFVMPDGTIITGMPLELLSKAKFPVEFDPDFAADSADAAVDGAASNYNTARGTASHNTDGNYSVVGQARISVTRTVYRLFYLFDTSAIGLASVISKVNLSLHLRTKAVTSRDFDTNIIQCDWSAYNPIDSTNRDSAFDLVLTSAEDLAIWQNSADIADDNRYDSGDLDTTWVVKNGFTYYALASNWDYDAPGSEPASSTYEQNTIYMQNTSTAGYRPLLKVTYLTWQPRPTPQMPLMVV